MARMFQRLPDQVVERDTKYAANGSQEISAEWRSFVNEMYSP